MGHKKIEKPCEECGKLFEAHAREVKRGNGKFCSRKCGGAYNGKKRIAKYKLINTPNVSCAQCGKEFYKKISDQNNSRSGLFFCRRKCKDEAQKIGGVQGIIPSHYGTTLTDYRTHALRNLPNECSRCSFDSVTEILQVHHKDCDRKNNTIENLEILCPNCHSMEHYATRTGLWARTKR